MQTERMLNVMCFKTYNPSKLDAASRIERHLP